MKNASLNLKSKIKVKKQIESNDYMKKNELDILEFISHELKNILGSTIMCVYSIRDGFFGMLNFKQRLTVEAAIRNLKRLECTIYNFLEMSRIEEDRLEPKIKKTNINKEIIKELADSFLIDIYEKKILFENNIPEDLVIETDKDLMFIVFNNLINNAIKYGPNKGRIVLNFYTEKGKKIKFGIYNDGEIIKDGDRKKIFNKFSRLESEDNKKIKGTGLGLFIVKKIIESFNGRIWVEPKKDGNEFIFEIER
ncbi:MAG: HAMP domain-containing sensor histidine kinase [Actinomycetota bacterium]|nr:HAMP domain-containing sensor histidine kinase [Actinomycetota bacterium]